MISVVALEDSGFLFLNPLLGVSSKESISPGENFGFLTNVVWVGT